MNPNESISERLAKVRSICQDLLKRLSLSTGIASSESYLLLHDRLWGVRFRLGEYDARWQVGRDEISVFEAGSLLHTLSIESNSLRQVA